MSSQNCSNIPKWIDVKLFEDILHQSVDNFKEIQNFEVFNALEPGENYATVMLKVAHDRKVYREHMSKWEMFKTESGMYREVVPELEELYYRKGLRIRFGAKAYELAVNQEYILMEDLANRGFRNVKRQIGMDMLHTKSVLKKLAQWHAASALRVAKKGAYDELYLHGFVTETGKIFRYQLFDGTVKYILAAVRKLPNNEQYFEKFKSILSRITDVTFAQAEFDANDFNVLNHGDFWCNNIMFQYDDQGYPIETYFVDLQMPRYGSPAQDLWYFICSSTQLNIKVDCFDELIRFYHDNLIDHLKILEYPKALPRLRDLHKKLLEMNVWGLMTVCSPLPGILCDPTDVASIDNVIEIYRRW